MKRVSIHIQLLIWMKVEVELEFEAQFVSIHIQLLSWMKGTAIWMSLSVMAFQSTSSLKDG